MGLSASQARLLMLTARLSDLELRAQHISNSKIRLSQEGKEASDEYLRALDKEKLMISTGVNNDGSRAQQDLNYFNLTGVDSPLLTQYALTNPNTGKVLVTQQEAAAFVQAAGSVDEFCDLMGAPTTITYSNSQGVTISQKEYNAAEKAYQDARTNLNSYASNNNSGSPRIKGYNVDGNWAYSDKTSGSTPVTYTDPEVFNSLPTTGSILTNAAVYAGASKQATYSTSGASNQDTAFCFYQSDEDDIVAAQPALANALSQIASDSAAAVRQVLQAKLGAGYSNVSGQIESAIATATQSTQSFYSSQLQNKQNFDGNDLNNVETIRLVQETNQIWDDTHGQHEYYIDLAQAVKTFLSNFDAAYAAVSGNPNPAIQDQIGASNTTRPATSNVEFVAVMPQDVNYNSSSDPDKIVYQPQNPNETPESIKAIYDPALTAYTETKEYYESFTNKKVVKSEHTDYYTNLFNLMKDNGYFTMQDESNTLNNSAWTQNQMLNNNLVLYKVAKEEGSDKMTWKSASWKTNTDIAEVDDKTYVAKAEAKYESTMADIQSKDKRFDLQLKQIDTEHQATQTTIESVKKVIDKNIERSFKMFQA